MKNVIYVLMFMSTMITQNAIGNSGGGGKAGAGTYQEIKPPFVVNLPDPRQTRFMQISVSVSAHNEEALKAVDLHSPPIRNNLIMLFTSQNKDTVITREGREKLRQDALEVVNHTLKEMGAPEIEALYFTSLVVQ